MCRPSRSEVPWLLVGTAIGFFATNFFPGFAVLVGFVLVAAALVRRRADAYGWFAVGFALGLALLVAMAFARHLTSTTGVGDSGRLGSDQQAPG